MNIKHRCPGCGKLGYAELHDSLVRRDKTCQACGEVYELRRDMRIINLHRGAE